MAILAIDQGTSGTKALVYADGDVHATVEVELHPAYGEDGSVQIAAEVVLDSVLDAGRRALAAAGVAPGEVSRIGIANQGESVLTWDQRTGRATSPVVVWQDKRAAVVTDRLTGHADEVAARTGLTLDCYFSAPKMAWLRESTTRDGVVTTLDTWLLHQLTGSFVTDASTASSSLLLDIDQRAWSPHLLEIFGLADEQLPDVLDNDATVGTTSAFGGSIEVGGLIVDQPAALLAQDCLAAGSAKCTFGTGAFLLTNTGGTAPRSASGMTTSIAWQTRRGTAYCLDGQVFTAGSAIRWLIRLGLIADAAEIDAVATPRGATLCVPALAGLGAPWWDTDARGVLTGLSLATTRGDIVRAVVDGLAAQVAELIDAVRSDTPGGLSVLRVDGGLTRSTALMQAVADIAGLPLEVYSSPHATALGVVTLARLADDRALTLADAVPSWSPAARYEPTADRDAIGQFRARWRQAAEQTRGENQ